MIESLQQFHFLRPGWLLLVPVAVVTWWLHRRSSDPLLGWRRQVDPVLLEALTEGGSRRFSRLPLLVSWLVACIALAGPAWRRIPSPFADEAAPLILLLKADRSMDRRQPEPSRIARAQLKIADIAELWKGQPLGLIAYAGTSHLVFPPTRDTEVVAQMAAEITPEIMPEPGDRLDLALAEARELLAETGGSIVVLADSVTTPVDSLSRSSGPSRILEVNLPGNADTTANEAAARAIGARLVELTPDRTDVERIARDAGRVRANLTEEAGARWQEAGFWLLPFLVAASALSFRRRSHATPG